MPLPDYQLTVIHPATGQPLTVITGSGIDDLAYSKVLNNIGALAMTLPESGGDWSSIFVVDSLIEVARTSPLTGTLQTEETYLTRLTHRFREGDEELFVIGGLSLNHLLARRVIDPDDDPLAAGGYSTKAGPADDVMRAYAREQCGDLASAVRQFPNFSVGPVLSVGKPVGKRARYENLFELFQELSQSGQMDFHTQRLTGNTLRLTIEPIGSDKSRSSNYPTTPFAMFNPNRGNLENPSLLIDRKDEKNFVYALGQGPGEFRVVAKVVGLGVGDSPYNRVEFTEDVRLAERGQSQQLLTGARDALVNNQAKKEFTFDLTGDLPGAVYGSDFVVGDVVTAMWDSSELNLRVTGVELSISADGESIAVTVSPQTIVQ
jgi:hypothetical protein